MKYPRPKGTFDVIPDCLQEDERWKLSHKWQFVEKIACQTAQEYGFNEIRTPIFESTELFTRTVGDASDIVSKEMYTFEDKGQRSLSLRPEGTAPVVRALLENHLLQLGHNHKFFYYGPYFRYDRPQAGRFRQFHQFGVEAIGHLDSLQDAEMIDLLYEIYRRLDLQNLRVLVNSVGDMESRQLYKSALCSYLEPHYSSLSAESQARFHKNPLRILDTKNPQEILLLEHAPKLIDFLSPVAKNHFYEVCATLTKIGIPFEIDSRLVRGLDYYNHTVFEIVSNVLGAQNTLGGGGRYDGLIKTLGGPDLPSIGFGTGIERILYTMEGQKVFFPAASSPFLFVISLTPEASRQAFSLVCELRHHHISTEFYSKTPKLQKALQEASSSGATYCLLLGEDELQKGTYQLKNLLARDSTEIPMTEALPTLKRLWKERFLEKK